MSTPTQWSRLEMLLGTDAVAQLHAAHVLVCGLGAVGSFAVEALARSGIGRLTLVDFDVVDPSNINRQLYALHSTIAQPKALLARQRVLDINPDAIVTTHQLRITEAMIDTFLTDVQPDFVIDAIDSVIDKVALLAACVHHELPVYASMGAARKTDLTQIRVADISKTQVCPLAKCVRRGLAERGIRTGVQCVYSQEPALPTEAPTAPGKPPLGSLMPITASFGLMLAREVILSIATRK